ncbi:MAG TPA: Gfo/Idh/MocA family oxidoreductase [Candidatus Sumerlaeia bacterium]|nr:Gfo/Idh/MocA family oxidoreductase [Candidatus Sumerlaeia bacterium]
MVQIAVVGIGFMGRAHLRNYSMFPHAQVTALCDVRAEAMDPNCPETAGNIAAGGVQFDFASARHFTDFEKMLDAGGFDMVDICLPTYLHAEHAVKALETGYHVFCEKPLAMTNAETRWIIETKHKCGRHVGVGHCLRYWPAYREVKKIIDGGKYGRVFYAEFARFSLPPIWGWDGWLMDSKRSGSAALDLHIHDVDQVFHLFGMPQAVRSRGVREKDGGFSHITTLYKYPQFDVMSTGGWNCSPSFGFVMRAFFILEGATIELDFSKSPALTVFPKEGEKFSPALPPHDGYFYELKDFTEHLETGNFENIVTAESAAQSIRLGLLEIESAHQDAEIGV